MTIKEVREISKLLPKFIMMCENDLEEDEHKIPGKLITCEEARKIEKLTNKLNNCFDFVNFSIFE